jgi:hypothetical protein
LQLAEIGLRLRKIVCLLLDLHHAAYSRIYAGIVITSLDSDSDSAKSTPPQNALTLENGELVSTAVVSALRGSASHSAFGGGRSALFDNRRWGDLTPLERMTAGMAGGTPLTPVRDEEMADATEMGQFEELGVAMDVEM